MKRLTIKTDRGDFSVCFWKGPPDAPILHWAHANGFNGFMYKTLLNKISNNQKIISYYLRGHGKSTIPAEPDKLKSWHRYSDDLINILNKNQYHFSLRLYLVLHLLQVANRQLLTHPHHEKHNF